MLWAGQCGKQTLGEEEVGVLGRVARAVGEVAAGIFVVRLRLRFLARSSILATQRNRIRPSRAPLPFPAVFPRAASWRLSPIFLCAVPPAPAASSSSASRFLAPVRTRCQITLPYASPLRSITSNIFHFARLRPAHRPSQAARSRPSPPVPRHTTSPCPSTTPSSDHPPVQSYYFPDGTTRPHSKPASQCPSSRNAPRGSVSSSRPGSPSTIALMRSILASASLPAFKLNSVPMACDAIPYTSRYRRSSESLSEPMSDVSLPLEPDSQPKVHRSPPRFACRQPMTRTMGIAENRTCIQSGAWRERTPTLDIDPRGPDPA